TFDLNGHNESVGPLSIAAGGKIIGGGALSLTGDVTMPAANGPAAGNTANVDLGSGPRPLSINGAHNRPVINGVGSWAAAPTRHGPGTLDLAGSAANTYTGDTFVSGGTLLLNNGATNGAVSKNIVIFGTGGGPGVLRLVQGGEIPNDAHVTVNFGGLFDLNGM